MARIRDVFASNLRGLLSQRGAIAGLEADTGISRVQISRYLNGTIPNEANLARIAECMGIDEHELFQPDRATSTSVLKRYLEILQTNVDESAPLFLLGKTNYLQLYFEAPAQKSHAFRSIVHLARDGQRVSFKRHTSNKRCSDSAREANYNYVHVGYASQVGEAIFLSGVNTSRPHEPSLISLSGLTFGLSLAYGTSIVTSINGPRPLRVVAEIVEGYISERQAADLAGVVEVDRLENSTAIHGYLYLNGPPDTVAAF